MYSGQMRPDEEVWRLAHSDARVAEFIRKAGKETSPRERAGTVRQPIGDVPAIVPLLDRKLHVVVNNASHNRPFLRSYSFFRTVTQLVTAEPPTLKATPMSAFFAAMPMGSPISCL